MATSTALSSLPAVTDRTRAVFIVDDDPDVRRTISLLVCSVNLAAETFASANEFLDRYDPEQPGCLVLDMRMPGMTGRQLQQELTDRGSSLPIIFVTAHGEIPTATEAMRAGAIDFITKPFSPQMLLERIHEAMAMNEKQRKNEQLQKEVQSRVATLTSREREGMEHLAAGESTKVIANRLGISTKTVDNHRAKVLEKVNVDNPTQLACLLADFK